jgi:hypothetical protein
MTYMASLSETRKQAADVLLECKDGKSLPCHYLLLESASRTLAGLGELVRREEDGKTKIPMEEVSEVVHAFLSWVYTHKITFEAPMAYRLAYLAHRLDSPGVLPPLLPILTALKPIMLIQGVQLLKARANHA